MSIYPPIFNYKRRNTRQIQIGDVPLGGTCPIRVQSMTNTPTLNTAATVKQITSLCHAGCDYVRLTVPTVEEARNLKSITDALKKYQVQVPLIADIHFNPKAAMTAADYVQKIRINPGNYAEPKQGKSSVSSNGKQYALELEKLHDRVSPLILKLKQNGVALRIGVNHGSLSERIVSRFGDTTLGMVTSALEYIEIAEHLGFFDLIISMKSSIPSVMIRAYRELVKTLDEKGKNYPLHLGVTEAGEGLDGRIKSAMGIGTLLLEGLGDTIRVSLTEDPEKEIPAARDLLKKIHLAQAKPVQPMSQPIEISSGSPSSLNPFFVRYGKPPWVGLHLKIIPGLDQWEQAGWIDDHHGWKKSRTAADFILIDEFMPAPHLSLPQKIPVFVKPTAIQPHGDHFEIIKSFSGNHETSDNSVITVDLQTSSDFLWLEKLTSSTLLLVTAPTDHFSYYLRHFQGLLNSKGMTLPIILWYRSNEAMDLLSLFSAADLGSLLNDGIGHGILIDSPRISVAETMNLSFSLLQAGRLKMTRPDYISCPSCGRTQYNIQATTQRIRDATSHLTGLKIAIMGCMVNGPGEMADADYGYVGAGPGKITLYRKKEVVEKNIPEDKAVEKLVALIKADGLW